MINSDFQIYYSDVTRDENGNPVQSSTFIDVIGHLEKKSVKTILKDEGEINKTFWWVRVTDSESIKKINKNSNLADYVIILGKKYTVKEINKYYSHIEIITQ